MKKSAAALGLLLATTLVACGSDDTTPAGKDAVNLSKAERTAAGTIAEAFTEESTGALTKTEATCFAEHFVDAAGLDSLKAAKLIDDAGTKLNQTGAEFDTALSEDFADSFLDCVDYHQRQAEQIAEADSTVDADKLQACLEDKLPESDVKKLIVASQTQSADAAKLGEESNKLLTACKTAATKK